RQDDGQGASGAKRSVGEAYTSSSRRVGRGVDALRHGGRSIASGGKTFKRRSPFLSEAAFFRITGVSRPLSSLRVVASRLALIGAGIVLGLATLELALQIAAP